MNFIIIGNGKMCIDCISIMLNYNNVDISLVIFSEKLDKRNQMTNFLKKIKKDFISTSKLNSKNNISLIKKAQPDYILNINSFWIIKEDILQIPKIMSINFHNGPLPKYGGVNIPSWAIINGEMYHGVTWHIIDEGIDTGDILWQEKFRIDDDITAGILMAKCIIEGIKLFEKKICFLLDNSFSTTIQKGPRTYYSLKDKPANRGVINFEKKYDVIYNLVRGLNYLPFNNDFEFSKIRYNNKEVIINRVSMYSINKSYKPGFIFEANSSVIRISCLDAIVQLESAMNQNLVSMNNDKIINELKIKKGNFINDENI